MNERRSNWAVESGLDRVTSASAMHRTIRTWAGSGVILAVILGGMAAGCTRIQTEKGLEPTWQAVDAETFQVGVSTQSEVLAALGPPSQVIAGNNGDIFYYLREEATGTGAIFILYNQLRLDTRYDRAIFFFDSAGVLQDYSISSPP